MLTESVVSFEGSTGEGSAFKLLEEFSLHKGSWTEDFNSLLADWLVTLSTLPSGPLDQGEHIRRARERIFAL